MPGSSGPEMPMEPFPGQLATELQRRVTATKTLHVARLRHLTSFPRKAMNVCVNIGLQSLSDALFTIGVERHPLGREPQHDLRILKQMMTKRGRGGLLPYVKRSRLHIPTTPILKFLCFRHMIGPGTSCTGDGGGGEGSLLL
jgi:hypothetical protein